MLMVLLLITFYWLFLTVQIYVYSVSLCLQYDILYLRGRIDNR